MLILSWRGNGGWIECVRRLEPQLAAYQHGCKVEVCFLLGLLLPSVIPKRTTPFVWISFRSSLIGVSIAAAKLQTFIISAAAENINRLIVESPVISSAAN